MVLSPETDICNRTVTVCNHGDCGRQYMPRKLQRVAEEEAGEVGGGGVSLKDHDKARRLKAKGEEQGRSSLHLESSCN